MTLRRGTGGYFLPSMSLDGGSTAEADMFLSTAVILILITCSHLLHICSADDILPHVVRVLVHKSAQHTAPLKCDFTIKLLVLLLLRGSLLPRIPVICGVLRSTFIGSCACLVHILFYNQR